MKVTGDWPPVNDKAVDVYFADTVNAMINTFRPRLKASICDMLQP
jgi:hypothetical protein